MFRQLDETISVASQMTPADIMHATAEGYKTVINNRPDHEANDQPLNSELEILSKRLGMTYHHIPVSHTGFSNDQIDLMVLALAKSEGRVLAFCRTGTRSTLLWALARSKFGDSVATIEAKAQSAGYSLEPIRHLLGA